MTTTNPALRPSAPTPSPRPSAPMPPSPKPPANAPKTTTRCIASPPCSRIWPPSASTTSNPPTTCRHSSNSPPSPRCNGEPSNSSASLTASVTRRQYTHSNTTKPQVTPHTSPSQGELRISRRIDEDDVDIEVEQVRDRVEDLRGDLAQSLEQKVHRPIRRVVGKSGAADDRDPFADPAGGGQLAGRFQCPLCHQREQHPLGRLDVQAPLGGHPVQRCADAQPLPELAEQPRAAEAARVQDIDLAGVRGLDRLCRVEEPRDRGDQPGQRVAVHGLRAAEVVDHLRRGHPGDRVAFAVRQLQIRHRRPVAVASLRLPQVHPYTVSTYSLVKSSDTPDLVCLHEFAVWVTLQASYQHNRSALPRNVPTNCGSRAFLTAHIQVRDNFTRHKHRQDRRAMRPAKCSRRATLRAHPT